MVLTADEMKALDACQNKTTMDVWRAVLHETYGGGDDEKN
jgi:hypothetical protein